jgi:hypothetical protein
MLRTLSEGSLNLLRKSTQMLGMLCFVRWELFMTVTMKNAVVWDVDLVGTDSLEERVPST